MRSEKERQEIHRPVSISIPFVLGCHIHLYSYIHFHLIIQYV
jgi:hypothetical protein